MKSMIKITIARLGLALLVLLSGPLVYAGFGSVSFGRDWRIAPRNPSGIAPKPLEYSGAVIQAYAARAFNWRGVFAVHTWIATKEAGAGQYEVHQVIGWRLNWNAPVRVSIRDYPDRLWYGAKPSVLLDIRGSKAATLIPKVKAAVNAYPYPMEYRVWPGPNSNTFVAWVARQVPELGLELPVTAIGKDFLANGEIFARAPSGSGFQFSVLGLFGLIAAQSEGLELNLLGLSFGIDPLSPALKIPGFGRLGMQR